MITPDPDRPDSDQPAVRDDDIEAIRKMYRDDPSDYGAAVSCIQHYSIRGWFNEAIEVCRDALERFPDDGTLLLEYGNAAFRKGDLSTAAECYSRFTAGFPERIEGWNNFGIVQTKLEAHEEAHESFLRVLAIEPENPGALLNLGNYHMTRGAFDEARTCFERATAAKPDFADAWYNLGNALIGLRRYGEASESFEKALRYSRDFPSALKNLGWVREQEGRFEEAKRCYEEAVGTSRADARLHVNLGNVNVKMKQYDEAKKCFLKAIRLAPHDMHGWMGLRGYALAKGDIGTFVRATLAVIGRLSDDTLAQSIEILYELNQTGRAGQLLAQADRLGRTGEQLDLLRMLIYQRSGKRAEAAAIAARFSGRDGLSDQMRRCLGRYYLHTEDFAAAERLVSGIAQPDEAALGTMWRAMIAMGKGAEAGRMIRRHVETHPESFDAYFLLAAVEAGRDNVKRAETLLVYSLDHGFTNLEEIRANPALNVIFESMTGKKLLEEA